MARVRSGVVEDTGKVVQSGRSQTPQALSQWPKELIQKTNRWHYAKIEQGRIWVGTSIEGRFGWIEENRFIHLR